MVYALGIQGESLGVRVWVAPEPEALNPKLYTLPKGSYAVPLRGSILESPKV